jgi:hypothetical protein
MNYTIIDTHISLIKRGDTIMRNGKMTTVCDSDIKTGGFCGITIFGDPYNMGNKLVEKVVFIKNRYK